MNNKAKKTFKAIRSASLNLDEEINNDTVGSANIYTLNSGRKVQFSYQHINADKVEQVTYVDQGNIRIPEELTKESLKIIIDSIKNQQFYPAIAQKNDDKFSILDGSRRRQAAIFAGVGLELLTCEESLSAIEVKELIKQLQTAEKFSPRDQGKHFTKLMSTGLTIDEVADIEGVSKSHISKCNKAWSIPANLISLFPIPLAITQAQFSSLNKVVKFLPDTDSLVSLISKIHVTPELSNEQVMEKIEIASQTKNLSANAVKVRKLVDINAKQWVKTKTVGSKQTIELSRISEDKSKQIEDFIVNLLAKKD